MSPSGQAEPGSTTDASQVRCEPRQRRNAVRQGEAGDAGIALHYISVASRSLPLCPIPLLCTRHITFHVVRLVCPRKQVLLQALALRILDSR